MLGPLRASMFAGCNHGVQEYHHCSSSHLQVCCLAQSSVVLIFPCFRFIDYDQATEISRCEEEFQAEIWGTVEGGHDLDRLNNRVSLSSVDTFMSLYWSDEKLEGKMNTWKNELAKLY